MRFAFHPTLARMLWSLGGPKCFRGESAIPRRLSRRPNLFTTKLECRSGSPFCWGPLGWRLFPSQREVLRHGRAQLRLQQAAISCTHLNMTRRPTLGPPSQPLTPTTRSTTWLAACSPAQALLIIYCVGGSAAGQATATARVFRYNPVTDTIDTLTGARQLAWRQLRHDPAWWLCAVC